jgi:hypothetical protein
LPSGVAITNSVPERSSDTRSATAQAIAILLGEDGACAAQDHVIGRRARILHDQAMS